MEKLRVKEIKLLAVGSKGEAAEIAFPSSRCLWPCLVSEYAWRKNIFPWHLCPRLYPHTILVRSSEGGDDRKSKACLGFPAGSVVDNLSANAGDTGDVDLNSGLGISSERGNGNSCQYSCLDSSMDRGAKWAVVHGGHKMLNTTERLSMNASSIYNLEAELNALVSFFGSQHDSLLFSKVGRG